jgi:uncharacterized membrane protein YkoI
MLRNLFNFLVLLFLIAGCANSDNDLLEVPDEVINKSLELFNGTVLVSDAVQEGTTELWKVRIRNTSGANVEFYWDQKDNSLYQITGLNGPYGNGYDIVPGNALINFNSAKFTATQALKNYEVHSWRLKKEDQFAGLWVYTLNYNENGGLITAYVNANNGEVLEID